MILSHGRGGVLDPGTANVLARDAGVGRGASSDLLINEALEVAAGARFIIAVDLVFAGARCVAVNVLIGARVEGPSTSFLLDTAVRRRAWKIQ